MKSLIIIVLTLLLSGGVAIAEDKEPSYELELHVVYNSIPVHEIANLLKDFLREHKDACKVEVKVNKPNYRLDNATVTIHPDDLFVTYDDLLYNSSDLVLKTD